MSSIVECLTCELGNVGSILADLGWRYFPSNNRYQGSTSVVEEVKRDSRITLVVVMSSEFLLDL